MHKFHQSMLKNIKKPIPNLTENFKNYPKWQNFAKSGHASAD